MTDNFEVLNNQADDLLSNDRNLFSPCWPHPIVKVYKLSDKLHEFLMKGLDSQKIFLNEGMPCEFLKLGSPRWRKGRLKVKLVLEFYPDEPESPLDDIRQMMKDNPQQDSA